MSNTLAIATVSAVFEARVTALLTSHGVLGMTVSTAHPADDPDPGVYLKLYHLTPNAALRNADLPTRRPDGSLATRPRLALDLHYLVSFVGDPASYDAERLAGAVMTDLHARPTLTLDEIADFLASLPAGHALASADLGDQLERVRFTPRALDLENLARVWTMLNQSFYGLSVAYDVSVVLLDADVRPREALPVAARGLFPVPTPRPRITAVHADGDTQPIARIGQTLVVDGSGLAGDSVSLRIGGHSFPVLASAISPTSIRFALTGALGLRAGVVAVQVVHRVNVGTDAAPQLRDAGESNAVALGIVPTVTVDGIAALGGGTFDVRLAVSPTPGADQELALQLDALAGSGSAHSSEWRLDGSITVFTVEQPPSGAALVRVRVDGAASQPTRDAAGTYVSPSVTFP